MPHTTWIPIASHKSPYLHSIGTHGADNPPQRSLIYLVKEIAKQELSIEIGENVSDVDALRAMISGARHGLEDSECAICLVQSSAVLARVIHAGFVRNRWRMRWAKVHSAGFIPRHVAISSTANALWRVSGLETSSARYV